MTSSGRCLVALVVAAGSALAACADFSRGAASAAVDSGAVMDAGENSDGAALSFAVSVHPLLLAACQHCHTAGAEAGGTQLSFTGDVGADFATVSRLIDTATPTGGRLLSKASGNGHGGGTVLAAGSPEYETVLEWIQQGARP